MLLFRGEFDFCMKQHARAFNFFFFSDEVGPYLRYNKRWDITSLTRQCENTNIQEQQEKVHSEEREGEGRGVEGQKVESPRRRGREAGLKDSPRVP